MSNDSLWISGCVAQWEKPLIAYARRLLGSDDAARDMVQETFLRLCRQPRHTIENRLVEWLFTVVRHCAIDHLRKEQAMQHRVEPLTADVATSVATASAVTQLETNESHQGLLQALATLPRNQQDCIRLKFQQHLSYQHISRVTGLSVTNVGYLIHMGIKSLRNHMTSTTANAGANS
jgi:RNA polymerase sigma-70 factor (ECF subfamily)